MQCVARRSASDMRCALGCVRGALSASGRYLHVSRQQPTWTRRSGEPRLNHCAFMPDLVARLQSTAAAGRRGCGSKATSDALEVFPDQPHFARRQFQVEDKLDMTHLLTQPIYSEEQLRAYEKQTHRAAATFSDKVAYVALQCMRSAFDVASGYSWKMRARTMTESDWLRRIIFLETVAAVPGMVAGMVRHLHSLRLMRRDRGWIHSLLAEAENQRMHLLIALTLRNPGPLFRAVVLVGQGLFLSLYSVAYLIVPSVCHRFVGYLGEDAVKTYTHLLEDIDADRLPLFEQMPAPPFARTYYHLPHDAMLCDVFECIRADESHHRDRNHRFGDLKPDEPNAHAEPLRGHR